MKDSIRSTESTECIEKLDSRALDILSILLYSHKLVCFMHGFERALHKPHVRYRMCVCVSIFLCTIAFVHICLRVKAMVAC